MLLTVFTLILFTYGDYTNMPNELHFRTMAQCEAVKQKLCPDGDRCNGVMHCIENVVVVQPEIKIEQNRRPY